MGLSNKASADAVERLQVLSWVMGLFIFGVGLANLILIHPVPGLVGMLLSLLYVPPFNRWLKRNLGFSVPLAFQIILFVAVIWFTLGVSDLGDLIDG